MSQQPSVKPSQVVYLPASSGPSFVGPGDTYTFLLTGEQSGGNMFILEATIPAGGGPPPHVHGREDETFYLLQGTLSVCVGDETLRASAGDFLHVPKGTVHSFRNDGEGEARMLAIFTPAGMEGYFLECLEQVQATSERTPIGEIIARMVAAAPNHGVEFVEG
jgi:quercetin dioxygenase-like cupin family protein